MSNASLPAAPLAVIVDRLVARAIVDDDHTRKARTKAYETLSINPRTLYSWRTYPRACVTMAVADRILSASPYLWFDVWPECAEHPKPARGCEACLVHHRARRAFTGKRVPKSLGAQS